MLYFFHEIHPNKHSKNHRGRRTCHSLGSGSQAGLCSFGWNCCYSFGSADKKKKPCAQPLPAFLPFRWRKWISAMAMDSVLISHFLSFGKTGPAEIKNEVLLFVLGVAFGILVNLLLHKKTDYIEELKKQTDNHKHFTRSIYFVS